MRKKRIVTVTVLIALPLLMLVGVKAASDKRDARAIEIVVRRGNNWSESPNAVRSKLDIRLVPLQTTIKPQPFHNVNGPGITLILPVRLENRSKQTIQVRLSHERHSGTWPPTDLFAYLRTDSPIAPVYRAGERGSAESLTTLAPGASKRLDLRMNWLGTGSDQGGRIMEDDRSATYSLRLLLMLGDEKNKSYVIGQKMRIRVEAVENEE